VPLLTRAGSETHAAIEQALRTSLRIGLGAVAKPVLLNAWARSSRLLLIHYGIVTSEAPVPTK